LAQHTTTAKAKANSRSHMATRRRRHSITPYSKEAQEVARVIDSLPPVSRQYLRDVVFRVATVARENLSGVCSK
jgi:hypothetical protein